MNKLDIDYQNLLKNILENGTDKQDRTGTGTRSIFGAQIKHDMQTGFPLLTTKKMAVKSMMAELKWFLRGSTDIRELWKDKCYIWDGDWYKHYITTCLSPYSLQEMKDKRDDRFFDQSVFSLGPIYGRQWRKWNTNKMDVRTLTEDRRNGKLPTLYKIDQIKNVIEQLKTNPDSRRIMVNSWNVGELNDMVLPPCHYGFQIYTRELTTQERCDLMNEKYGTSSSMDNSFSYEEFEREVNQDANAYGIPKRAISLLWNQRSVDTFLGLPFNIASYGMLLELIAKEVNMMPDQLIGNLGDTHLYLNHLEQAKEQIGRQLTIDERFKIWFDTKKPNRDSVEYYDGFKNTLEAEVYKHNFFDERDIPRRTREPFKLPTLKIIESDIYNGEFEYELLNYISHPTIKAPLSN